MSDLPMKLKASDFSQLTVLRVDVFATRSPQVIGAALIRYCKAPYGLVLSHRCDTGEEWWTPTWRKPYPDDPGLPASFPAASIIGYANTVPENIDRARYWATIKWRDAKADSTVQLLVFESAADATAVCDALSISEGGDGQALQP